MLRKLAVLALVGSFGVVAGCHGNKECCDKDAQANQEAMKADAPAADAAAAPADAAPAAAPAADAAAAPAEAAPAAAPAGN